MTDAKITAVYERKSKHSNKQLKKVFKAFALCSIYSFIHKEKMYAAHRIRKIEKCFGVCMRVQSKFHNGQWSKKGESEERRKKSERKMIVINIQFVSFLVTKQAQKGLRNGKKLNRIVICECRCWWLAPFQWKGSTSKIHITKTSKIDKAQKRNNDLSKYW